jgi:dienelactone hydrolase
MVRPLGVTIVILLTRLAVSTAEAQQRPFYYPAPPPEDIQVMKDVSFATVDTLDLAMDVYRPAHGSTASPGLILYSLYWPEDGDRPARESNDHARNWARIAAANGIVAVIPDLRAEPGTGNAQAPARAREGDFDRLVAHLVAHASEYGIDARRLAVFAASGNVSAALPAIEDPGRTAVKAAVIYYGGAGADVARFRSDLPLLYVRAGQDSPAMNAAIDALVSRAVSQNVPLTLINYPAGHHAFEAVDDTAMTGQIIDQTIEFVKRATGSDGAREVPR